MKNQDIPNVVNEFVNRLKITEQTFEILVEVKSLIGSDVPKNHMLALKRCKEVLSQLLKDLHSLENDYSSKFSDLEKSITADDNSVAESNNLEKDVCLENHLQTNDSEKDADKEETLDADGSPVAADTSAPEEINACVENEILSIPDTEVKSEESEIHKPRIKLVDINKLLMSSAKGNNSVIVLSSSEEETTKSETKSKLSTTNKKNGEHKSNREVRSNLSRSKNKGRKSESSSTNKRETRKTRNNYKEKSSASSSDSESSSYGKNRNAKSKQIKHVVDNKSVKEDEKFKCKCYVSLKRENLTELKEAFCDEEKQKEIERLCDLSSLKKRKKAPGSGGKTMKKKFKAADSFEDQNESDGVDDAERNTSVSDLSGSLSNLDNSVEVNCNIDSDNDGEADKLEANTQDSEMQEKNNEKNLESKQEKTNSDTENEDNKNLKVDNTDTVKKKNREKKTRGRILSDTDDESEKKSEKDGTSESSDASVKTKSKKLKKKVKTARKVLSDSESEEDKKSEHSKSSQESSNKSESEESEKSTKKKSRKRIRRVRDSSSDEDDEKSTRKNIRKVIGKSSLSESTLKAEAEEKERKARILEKQKKYNQIFDVDLLAKAKLDKVVLDVDEKTNKELLAVEKYLVEHLKPHQASGIQFMWNACFESIKRAQKTKGSGCILAHCMGLGKTLQVIALVHALLTHYEETKVKKILVVTPLNTVLNWKAEFQNWLDGNENYEVFELASIKQNYERRRIAEDWDESGGVLILSYEMFRNLTNPENKRLNKKLRKVFATTMVDPGPDLVVCDEGHLLKNEKTNLSIAMNRLRTLRRIVLTGTPLQNNMKEYFCMVQFVKPNLLGTYKEYLNRFVNPITNGQYTDSTEHDIMTMRRRSHVLHKLLDGVVQRRDYAVLQPYLPPKYEYVLFLKISNVQAKMYEYYLSHFAKQVNNSRGKTSFLFSDFQNFQRICSHPKALLDKSVEDRNKKWNDESEDSAGSLKDFVQDGSTSESEKSSSGSSSSEDDNNSKKGSSNKPSKQRVTRAMVAQGITELSDEDDSKNGPKEWWQEFCDGSELDDLTNSSKLCLLFNILRECEQIGDKILVFSQSLYSLNIIEYFLEKVDEATTNGTADEKCAGFTGSWCLGLDYFRLDGSSSSENRASWCKTFNDPENIRARLFLISTRAGGLGINLVAANRVIIFDVSWNPSHDIQSIYRIYRFGQTKPCYVYRFVSYGTMEMKIYERQVTKQAISKRVIDEQQIDRHYKQNDLQELYMFEHEPDLKTVPLVPKDVLLAELLHKYEDMFCSYHEHQSLLENKEDEILNEEERKAAWEEFENEKVMRTNVQSNTGNTLRIGALHLSEIQAALRNIIFRDNPGWSNQQINLVIPQLVQQLQFEMITGNFSMYQKVVQEVQMIKTMLFKRQQEMEQRRLIMQQQLAGSSHILE